MQPSSHLSLSGASIKNSVIACLALTQIWCRGHDAAIARCFSRRCAHARRVRGVSPELIAQDGFIRLVMIQSEKFDPQLRCCSRNQDAYSSTDNRRGLAIWHTGPGGPASNGSTGLCFFSPHSFATSCPAMWVFSMAQ